jgi:hypothetical protein
MTRGQVRLLHTGQSREQTFQEYQAARQEVLNNDNLSPSEKEERLQQLREAYERAQQNPDSPDNPVSKFIQDTFGGLGMVEKASLLVAVVIAYKVVSGGDN